MTANDDAQPPDVVVALQSVGVSARVAKQLATQHDPAHIYEKLAFLAFLQEKDAVSHPAGWLRSAIVDDYARPDGFMTPDERATHQAAQEAEQAALPAYQLEQQVEQPETLAALEDAQRAQESMRVRQVAQLRRTHNVQPEDEEFGVEVMAHLQSSCVKGSLLYTLLPLMVFLKYDAQLAYFAVATDAALKQLQHPGTQTTLRRTLRFLRRAAEPDLRHEEIRLEFCLMPDLSPDPVPEEIPEAGARDRPHAATQAKSRPRKPAASQPALAFSEPHAASSDPPDDGPDSGPRRVTQGKPRHK